MKLEQSWRDTQVKTLSEANQYWLRHHPGGRYLSQIYSRQARKRKKMQRAGHSNGDKLCCCIPAIIPVLVSGNYKWFLCDIHLLHPLQARPVAPDPASHGGMSSSCSSRRRSSVNAGRGAGDSRHHVQLSPLVSAQLSIVRL